MQKASIKLCLQAVAIFKPIKQARLISSSLNEIILR